MRKKFIIPSIEEFISYFRENGFSSQLAERVYKGYSENEWKDSRDHPIVNWKLKCQHVWFKETNREKSKLEQNIGHIQRNMR